jgi:general secretion pathway protein D
VQVEISQLGAPIEGSGGQAQPTIGTRQIQTVIRLRDGETNILAGLIGREEQSSHSGVAGLSDIPGLKHIFGSTSKTVRETDIIMTLTPRIIRVPDITEQDLATLWVGTEEKMRLRGAAREALHQGPFGVPREEAFPPPGLAADPLQPLKRTRGSLGRITPSAEVQRERESDARQAAAAEAAQSQSTPAPGVGSAPPPAQPPPPAEPIDDGGDAAAEDPAGLAVVSLVPFKPTYSVGETVAMSLNIADGEHVGSVPLHLHYNTSVLEYVTYSKGPFLEADGTSAVMFANDTGGGGEIVVGLSRLGGGAGASGNGVLATFEFLAVGEGGAGFAFSGASVRDGQANVVPAQFSAVQVNVEP